MATQTGPNVGIVNNWAPGDNGWSTAMNASLRAQDAFLQPTVKTITTITPPGSPSEGDAYVIPSGATGAWAGKTNQITRWSAGLAAWEFWTPKNGWLVFNQGDNSQYQYTGIAWVIRGRGQQIFTANGTFNVPANVSTVWISACGGGGGGGGGGSANAGLAGGGGGGGAAQSIIKQAFTVTPGAAIPITIGVAGTAGTAAASGGGTGGAGGAGGSTVIGSLITITGGAGGNPGSGTTGFGAGGQGGGGAPSGGYGADGGAGAMGGIGGSNVFGGGGAGGRGAQGAPITGGTAAMYGAGGGGAGGVYASNTQAGAAGGTGSPGIVIIEW